MPSSRAAFDLSDDLRVIPPVTAATMPLVALSALRRSDLSIGEDGSVPPVTSGVRGQSWIWRWQSAAAALAAAALNAPAADADDTAVDVAVVAAAAADAAAADASHAAADDV